MIGQKSILFTVMAVNIQAIDKTPFHTKIKNFISEGIQMF
jgi:hypothetical protein